MLDVLRSGEMSPTMIFNLTVVFSWVMYLWKGYLDCRQYRVIIRTKLNTKNVSIEAQKNFNKSKAYALHRERLHFVRALFVQLQCMFVLYMNVVPYLWMKAAQFVTYLRYDHEINQTTAFVVMCTLIETALALPWKLYATFVMEQKYGFNKQTLRFFGIDQLKSTALSLALMIPMTAVLVTLLNNGGQYFYVYAWAFVSLITLLMVTVYPEYIAPLFDKFTPLSDGRLRTQIEALAKRLRFPLKQLYVVQGSQRSAHSNAYLAGLGQNKRIVLYDTLLEDSPEQKQPIKAKLANLFKSKSVDTPIKNGELAVKKVRARGCTTEEVVAILAHELGHWKCSHVTKMLLVNQLVMLLAFWGFAYFFTQKELYHAFGFESTYPAVIGMFLVFEYVFAPFHELLSVATTVFTRYNEIQADKFAADLGYSEMLKSALGKLDEDNLQFPANDWLYAWMTYDHPPTAERIHRLNQLNKAKSL